MWLGCCFALLISVGPPEGDWPLDIVRLKNGAVFRGLILGEDRDSMRFQVVRREAGRPTVSFATVFLRAETAAVERIADDVRGKSSARLKELFAAVDSERQRQQMLELLPEPDAPGGPWWRYASERFVLRSNAAPDVIRRAAVGLEQIYAAYARFFPVRRPGATPTAIVIFRSRAEYQAQVAREGRAFANPAYYDPAGRRIVTFAESGTLAEEIDRVRGQHRQLRGELDRQEAALEKLYRGPELLRHVQPIRDTRRKIELAENQNDLALEQANRRLQANLFHEAFHAYADSFVYPPTDAPLPRWLHEGLAQVFESAIIEAGELRVGHAEPGKLLRAKELARKKALIPVGELVASRGDRFATENSAQSPESDRYYLTAWVYAHWLVFDRRATDGTAFTTYLSELKLGRDPLESFGHLAGVTPAGAERTVYQYIAQLQSDGSLATFNPSPGAR